MARLSVLIPAYSRHPMTARHYAECMTVTRVPDEIIVVNDGGDPSLREMIIDIPRTCDVVYARVDQDITWNYNGAVNLAFWLSTGDVIALEDTDHVPSKYAYENGLRVLEEQPEVSRVAFKRHIVQIGGFAKPIEEWTWQKSLGSNQMVTMFRRDLYLQLKGQDERFCGQYGYMAYDWHNRYNNMLKVKSATSGHYWAVFGDEGEPGLKRGLSPVNRKFYKENSQRDTWQHPQGILNFTYKYERWTKNT